jgi:hypothetical protein
MFLIDPLIGMGGEQLFERLAGNVDEGAATRAGSAVRPVPPTRSGSSRVRQTKAARLGSGHGRLCVEAAAWSGLGCVGVVTADNNRGDLGWPCT